MAVELAAHWRAYRRAVSGYDPVPFAWTSIGYRIRATGEALRRYLGYGAGEHCNDMLATAGTLTFAGKRRKRERTFYRTTKQELVPESALPGPWEFLSFGLARPVPSRKKFKKYRAVARGENVFIRYKGRNVFFKACVTKDGARNIAARINGRKPKVSRLTRSFERKLCPHCDQSVAVNWWDRHLRMYHQTEERSECQANEIAS